METLTTQFVSLFLLAIFGVVSVSAFYHVITELKPFERESKAHGERENAKTEKKLRRKSLSSAFSDTKGGGL